MEKVKRTVQLETRAAQPSRAALPIILIGVGIFFLLTNTGILSISDIAGSIGDVARFIGETAGSIGRMFGELGRAVGSFFGGLGGAIGQFWPLVLILIGGVMLFRRGKTTDAPFDDR